MYKPSVVDLRNPSKFCRNFKQFYGEIPGEKLELPIPPRCTEKSDLWEFGIEISRWKSLKISAAQIIQKFLQVFFVLKAGTVSYRESYLAIKTNSPMRNFRILEETSKEHRQRWSQRSTVAWGPCFCRIKTSELFAWKNHRKTYDTIKLKIELRI